MTDERRDILPGTLELLVLRTLNLEPMHGWGMAQRIETMSKGVLLVQQGTLYPALQRMKRRGWVKSEWRQTANNRRARYYLITAAGRKQLHKEEEHWRRTSAAVNGVLGWEEA